MWQVVALTLLLSPVWGAPGALQQPVPKSDPEITRTCDETIAVNETYFINKNPSTTQGTNCKVTVRPVNTYICQLRLDFHIFEVAQPDNEGRCNDAFFKVSKTMEDQRIPLLCGLNSGQHMYVNIDPYVNPELMVDQAAGSRPGTWHIKVSQIECFSQYRAPRGCLQYYQQTSSTFQSFNYREASLDEIRADTVNHHLRNLNYAICIPLGEGFCSTELTPVGTRSFLLTENGNTRSADIGVSTGLNDDPLNNDATPTGCTDYLVIPGSTFSMADAAGATIAGSRDRYCGLAFPTVTSTSPSTTVIVRTDGAETTSVPADLGNVGFHLKYRNLPCGPCQPSRGGC